MSVGSRSVGVAVVSYAPGPELRESVESALGAAVGELVVWDNSRRPLAQEVLAGVPNITIQSSGVNLGFGAANNRAVELFSSNIDLLLFLNPDCVIRKDALAQMIAAFDDPQVGIVGVQMKYPDGSMGVASGSFPHLVKEIASDLRLSRLVPRSAKQQAMSWFDKATGKPGFGASFEAGAPVKVDWVSGFCMLVKRETFEAVGGFDERFFLYYEDVDICRRAAVLGIDSVLVRDASALHHESLSMRRAGTKSLHYRTGRSTYFRIHGTPPERWLFSASHGRSTNATAEGAQ